MIAAVAHKRRRGADSPIIPDCRGLRRDACTTLHQARAVRHFCLLRHRATARGMMRLARMKINIISAHDDAPGSYTARRQNTVKISDARNDSASPGQASTSRRLESLIGARLICQLQLRRGVQLSSRRINRAVYQRRSAIWRRRW